MNDISGKPSVLKEINKSLIIKFIRSKDVVTRAEIVEHTQISHTTVRNILRELIDSEEVLVCGLEKSSGGRRAEIYKINANKNCIIAATVEDKKLHYRVVNLIGEILSESSVTINSKEDIEAIFNVFDEIIYNFKNIKYVGITVPGIVTDRGYINGIEIDIWKEILLKDELKRKYNIPCILENDLNAVALGYFRNNKENKNMVYINFTDLGVGSGIVINGEIFKGEIGFAGEVGVLPIENTYLNEIALGNTSDKRYIDAVVKTIKIICSLLNPKAIVLGGNMFRYSLQSEIINQYEKQFSIKTNIIIDNNQINYGLLGITEIVLDNI